MHLEKPKHYENISIAKFSAVDDGFHIEIALKDKNGNEEEFNPVITFRENENNEKQVVIHRDKFDIVFPLSELKRAIEIAEKEVHSESFYDKNT